MRGPIPCPLCVGLGFTQIETLFNSLLSLLKQVQICPDSTCTWRGEGLHQLLNHLSLHSNVTDNLHLSEQTPENDSTEMVCEQDLDKDQDHEQNLELDQDQEQNLEQEMERERDLGMRDLLNSYSSINQYNINNMDLDNLESLELNYINSSKNNLSKTLESCLSVYSCSSSDQTSHPASNLPTYSSFSDSGSNPGLESNLSSYPGSVSSPEPLPNINPDSLNFLKSLDSACSMNENEIPLSPNRSQGLTELPSKPDLYENSNHGSPVVQSSSPGVFKPRQQLKMTDRSKMKNRICRQSSEDKQNVECMDCGWTFDNQRFLNLHRIFLHSSKPVPSSSSSRGLESTCTTCSKQFINFECFEKHMSEVHNDSRYFCRFCYKSFKLRGSLLVHQRVLHQSVIAYGAQDPQGGQGTQGGQGGQGAQGAQVAQVTQRGHEAQRGGQEGQETQRGGQDAHGVGQGAHGTQSQDENNHRAQGSCRQVGEISLQSSDLNPTRIPEDTLMHGSIIFSGSAGTDSNHASFAGPSGTGHSFASFPGSTERGVSLSESERTDPNNLSISGSGRMDTKGISLSGSNRMDDAPDALLIENMMYNSELKTRTQGRVEDNTNSFKSEDSIPENNLEQKTKNDSPDMFAVVEVATGDKHGDLVTQAKFEQSAKSDGLEKGEIVTDLELYEGCGEGFEGKYWDAKTCNMCTKTFNDKNQFEHHVKSHHETKQWECTVCGKKFTTKYFLKKHRRLHTGETPYSCDLCGKTFSFQQSYHKHMLYHTDEKPYSCNTCGRAFKELSTLQNHERIHSGERPFVCETCGKSFRQRVSYLVHRRIHTGVMPYICDQCGKKFRYKVTQRTHKCTGRANLEPKPDEPISPKSDLIRNFQPSPVIFNSNPQEHQPQPVIQDRKVYRQPSSPASSHNIYSPYIPPEIKQNLLNFRRAQGKRQLGHRLQNILERSRRKSAVVPQHTQPIIELQDLSLIEQNQVSPAVCQVDRDKSNKTVLALFNQNPENNLLLLSNPGLNLPLVESRDMDVSPDLTSQNSSINSNPDPGSELTNMVTLNSLTCSNPGEELNLANLEILLSSQIGSSDTEITIENSIDDFDISALHN